VLGGINIDASSTGDGGVSYSGAIYSLGFLLRSLDLSMVFRFTVVPFQRLLNRNTTKTPTSVPSGTSTNAPTSPKYAPTLTPTDTSTYTPTSTQTYVPTHTPTTTPTHSPSHVPTSTITKTPTPSHNGESSVMIILWYVLIVVAVCAFMVTLIYVPRPVRSSEGR